MEPERKKIRPQGGRNLSQRYSNRRYSFMFDTSKRMEALPFSGIRVMMERANRMQKEGQDVIHMEIGRPDFDTPEVIKKAAYDSLEKGHVFYTSNYGTP